MADLEIKSGADPRPANPRSPLEVVFASATEAFGSAIVVWILGDLALSLASSFVGDLMPSLPPCFHSHQPSETRQSGNHHGGGSGTGGGAFVLFFAIFFAHSLWKEFHDGEESEKRIGLILSNLREHWFKLIVGNAISAWFAALVLGLVADFSPTQILWHLVWGLVLSIFQGIAEFFVGTPAIASLGAWTSWYGANQEKLAFWIIYLGGVFDDLGVPNFKTLARWAWRRYRKRHGAALPVTNAPTDVV